MMLNREEITEEFVTLVSTYYPRIRRIIDQCYVKLLECTIERSGKHFYYIGIYYPEGLIDTLRLEQDALKEIAENMGLIEVVYINATRLVRDPLSKIKKENPRLWLELYWVATQHKQIF